MGYQLIATDLDGTLLNSRSMLSQRTINTIERLKVLDKIIVIASGRTYGEIVRLIEPLNLLSYHKAYFICYNGVLTVKTHPFTVLMKMSLHKEDVQEIIKSIGPTDLKFHVFGDNKLFLSNDIELSLESHQSKDTKILKVDMNHYDQIEDVYKILLYHDKKRLDTFKNNLPPYIANNFSVVKSNDQLLEIFHKEGSKGHALEYLSNILKIDRDEVIAFGDEENDMTMIQYAGLGVAMGNAKPNVIAAADYITLSHDFDGVAVALDKYIK